MATWKQTHPNSCGAAALMCAAKELGVDDFNGNALVSKAAEDAIYQVTAHKTGGYSYPSGIARGAKQLGLTAEVYISPSKGLTFLTGRAGVYSPGLLKTEWNQLKTDGVTVHNQKATGLPPKGEYWLKCITALHFVGLHWVLIRSAGLGTMDPGNGQTYGDIDDQKKMGGDTKWIHGTGLTVLIKK